jgi:hypothetical protein
MAFKMKGFPVHGTSAVKHIRSEKKRPGHNKKYHATDPSNDAHGEYWTDGSKEEEIKAAEAGTTSDTKTTKKVATKKETEASNTKTKKKKGLLHQVAGKIKEGVRKRSEEIKEKRKGQKKVLKNKFNPSAGWKWVDK